MPRCRSGQGTKKTGGTNNADKQAWRSWRGKTTLTIAAVLFIMTCCYNA